MTYAKKSIKWKNNKTHIDNFFLNYINKKNITNNKEESINKEELDPINFNNIKSKKIIEKNKEIVMKMHIWGNY